MAASSPQWPHVRGQLFLSFALNGEFWQYAESLAHGVFGMPESALSTQEGLAEGQAPGLEEGAVVARIDSDMVCFVVGGLVVARIGAAADGVVVGVSCVRI